MSTMRYPGSRFIIYSTSDPGVSETADTGNLWLNTSTGNLFVCEDSTPGSQVWDEYFAATTTPTFTNVTIGTLTITSGSGAPSSSQPQGSLYLRTDGSGATNRMYVATDSIGTWTAVVTVA